MRYSQTCKQLGAHHQISREGSGQLFLCKMSFSSFSAARFFFWPMLEDFLVVALLHDFFLTILPCMVFSGEMVGCYQENHARQNSEKKIMQKFAP